MGWHPLTRELRPLSKREIEAAQHPHTGLVRVEPADPDELSIELLEDDNRGRAASTAGPMAHERT